MALPIMTNDDERDLDIAVTGAGCHGSAIVDSVEAAWARLTARHGVSGALRLVRAMVENMVEWGDDLAG